MAKTQVRVRYQETDQMGIVHHSVYAIWFEVGRSELIRELGYSYQFFEERGLLLPVVDYHCRFVSPARFDDQIIIQTTIKELRGAKMVFAYELFHETGARIAHGETIHLWVDQTMKPVRFQEAHPTLYNKFQGRLKDI
ncbi:acyl-CoA thioesterase [Marininema halotolerans]|nr:thioesterase family protein [Marininema halotolerans]